MPKFRERLRIEKLTSAASAALDILVNGDSESRIKVDAGGKVTWGDGSAAGDTNLYRDSENTLKTDDKFIAGKELVSAYSSGDEGGEIQLAIPQTNTTISSSVAIDVYQNKLRIYETGGSNRGAYIDLTAASNGVASNLLASGGGASALDDLTDVTITSATNGQVLKYNGTAWVNDTDNAGTSINNLDDIGDVTITGVANGDFLTYNGTAWVNDAAPTYVQFDTSVGSPAATEGKLQWDSDFGTLSFGLEGNNSLQHIGMNQFAYCYNAEATTLNKGEAVYIFGGQGSQVSVKRASNVGDPTSSKTLGIVSESISSGGSGYVCTYGVLQGIDTSGYSEGDILYLGETAGTLTDAEPTTPNHLVFMAVVIKSAVGGELWIRPQNGYEIGELHDVSISSPASGDVVTYNGTSWVNQQPMPAGSITQFAGSSAPSGWLTCDGTAVSRTTYAALFAVIGTTYGAGDGSTTFALPNLKGKVPVGYDSTQTEFDSLGETGGAKTHTLTTAEMPSHTHAQDAHGHTGTALTAGEHTHVTNAAYNTSGMGPAGAYAFYHYVRSEQSSSAGSHSHTLSINNATATNQNTGGGQAHNNLQPYIVLNYIIKT